MGWVLSEIDKLNLHKQVKQHCNIVTSTNDMMKRSTAFLPVTILTTMNSLPFKDLLTFTRILPVRTKVAQCGPTLKASGSTLPSGSIMKINSPWMRS